MKQILYILIGLFSYLECKSCDCSYEQRAISITNSILNDDLIFCGELVPGNFVNPFVSAYKFRVLEVFKGDYSKEFINGCIAGMCSIEPQSKGLWIVYATLENDSTISIHKCSPTISMLDSEKLAMVHLPYYFLENDKWSNDRLKFEVQSLANKVEGQFYWLAELEQLRHYKRTQSTVNKNFDLKSILICCLILMNIALIIVTLTSRRR